MNTLERFSKFYPVDLNQKSPIFIPGTRDHDLPNIFNICGFRLGVEVGVERGVYSAQLLRQLSHDTKLIGVDPLKAYKGYREHVTQYKLDGFLIDIKNAVKPFGERYEFVREFSIEAAKGFENESLDFVYLDGNHEYFHVVDDLRAWLPKVRPGGIISGHDFKRNSGKYTNDVKDVIGSYTYARRISPWFVIDDKHSAPSWFWFV